MAAVRLVERVHERLAPLLGRGDIAVDATMGNGHDTLFLARRVGSGGRVYGFDRQPEAVTETRRRLRTAGLLGRVSLVLSGHELLEQFIDRSHRGRVKVVMFNLGYRPGGDKRLTTRAGTTLAALDAVPALLAADGVVSVVAYPGHAGGLEETEAVRCWAETVDRGGCSVSVQIADPGNPRSPEWTLAEWRCGTLSRAG